MGHFQIIDGFSKILMVFSGFDSFQYLHPQRKKVRLSRGKIWEPFWKNSPTTLTFSFEDPPKKFGDNIWSGVWVIY